MIQSPKPELRIMRYELSDYEWTAIKPMLQSRSRGVRRVNDPRVLNGILWVLHSGAPRRDLLENICFPHHLLRSLCPLAAGWHLGPDHGSPAGHGAAVADDRYLGHPRCSARGHRHPAPLPSSSPTASGAGRWCASILLPWSPDSSRPHSPGSVR